jgi:hypothetical protein
MDEKDAGAATGFARRHWALTVDGLAAAFLIGMCVFGLAAADVRASFSREYWSAMPLAFGVVAVALTALHGADGLPLWKVAMREALHWFGAVVGIQIVFYFIDKNQFTESNAGLACGLVIALATFMAGVHIQWRLVPIGAALLAATALTAFVEQNLFTLVAVMALGLAGALMVGHFHRQAEARRRAKAERTA